MTSARILNIYLSLDFFGNCVMYLTFYSFSRISTDFSASSLNLIMRSGISEPFFLFQLLLSLKVNMVLSEYCRQNSQYFSALSTCSADKCYFWLGTNNSLILPQYLHIVNSETLGGTWRGNCIHSFRLIEWTGFVLRSAPKPLIIANVSKGSILSSPENPGLKTEGGWKNLSC